MNRGDEEENEVQSLAGILFFLSHKSPGGEKACEDVWTGRRCEEEVGGGAANRKLYVLRVKGQPPRSGQVATVGTDQSQCHNHIDRLWTHTSILSDVHTCKTVFVCCHQGVSALCMSTHSH